MENLQKKVLSVVLGRLVVLAVTTVLTGIILYGTGVAMKLNADMTLLTYEYERLHNKNQDFENDLDQITHRIDRLYEMQLNMIPKKRSSTGDQ